MDSFRTYVDWLWQAKGAPYVWWLEGEVSRYDGPPAWAVNAPLPDISEITGGFCVAVYNLACRYYGLQIPPSSWGEDYDGGVVSTWEYWYDSSIWYSERRRQGFEDGDLLISPYNDASSQGHVAMICHWEGEPLVLEWITTSGLTWKYSPDYSSTWGDYRVVVPKSLWAKDFRGGGEEPPAKSEVFSVDHLLSVYTQSLSRANAESYFPHMVRAFREFDISTRERIAAFLGHAVGEVGEFTYWEEIEPDWNRFGGYHGRGPLQLTWREAYQQATDYYQAHHPEDKGVDFVADPDLVATPKYGFWTSAWYWRNGPNADLNPVADRGDFAAVIEAIFGAPYPSQYQLRWDYYNWAMKVLPAELTLEAKDEPTDPVEPVGGGDVVFGKYTFVAALAEQVAVDLANAAVTTLESVGVDCLCFNGSENIKMTGDAAIAVNDVGKLNCLVVGSKAHAALSDNAGAFDVWADKNPIWPLFELSDAAMLKRVRDWALAWIAIEEKLDKEHLVSVFDNVLLAINEEYQKLLDQRDDHSDPPEPVLTLEQKVDVLWAEYKKEKK